MAEVYHILDLSRLQRHTRGLGVRTPSEEPFPRHSPSPEDLFSWNLDEALQNL